MGVGLFDHWLEGADLFPAQNPDPTKFSVIRAEEHGLFVAVEVHYPNCTTYEGRKIMVLKASKVEVERAKRLDPHFQENAKLSPVARFEPTDRGWSLAVELATKLGDSK